MKTFKRTLAFFLALLTVISVTVIGFGAASGYFGEHEIKSNGTFEYYIDNDNSVVICRAIDKDYTGKTFTIPAKIDGHKFGCLFDEDLLYLLRQSGNDDTITSVKIEEGIESLYTDYIDEEHPNFEMKGVFAGLKNLRNISLPKSLKSLNGGMFSGCTSLKKVKIPKTIVDFGTNIFSGCTALKEVKLPSNMEYVPSYMFKNCKSLESIWIPSSVKGIGESAFAYCESLEGKLKLPESLSWISRKAFYGCKSLTGRVEIPKNVKEISGGAFAFCTGLTGFRIAEGNNSFSQKSGVLFNKNKTELYSYLSGKKTKEYKIPSTVKEVSEYAFAGTKYLRKVTLSKKMTETGKYAFYKSSVREVVLPKSLQMISEGTFKNCKNLKSISLPLNLDEIQDSAFENCTSLKEIKLPPRLHIVGCYTFKGCSSLKSLSFPKSVWRVEIGALDKCKNLKTVKFFYKNCDIYFLDGKISRSKPTIYGYKKSTAKDFAKRSKLKFVTM